MNKLRDLWRLLRPTAYMTLLLAAITFPYWIHDVHFWETDLERRFRLVRPGMTYGEVVGTLGVPAGEYGPPGARYAGPWND